MNTENLTIIALFVNVGALIFVGVQTWLNRRALNIAEKNFKESQRAKEIYDLPKGNLFLTLRAEISNWREQLQKIIDDEEAIKARMNKGDTTLGKEYGIETSEGIMHKWLYDNSPGWIQILYGSAAQYYFRCKGGGILSIITRNERYWFTEGCSRLCENKRESNIRDSDLYR